MPRLILPFLFLLGALTFGVAPAQADGEAGFGSRFYYHDFSGRSASARIIWHYRRVPIVHPLAHIDNHINPKLMRAATIAEERANARSKGLCWRYVKTALVASGALDSYPKTTYALQAGSELVHSYGFVRLSSIHDPYAAPVGAVLVYGDSSRSHVEIRTRDGFVSDYHSKNRCFYPLLAVYAKL